MRSGKLRTAAIPVVPTAASRSKSNKRKGRKLEQGGVRPLKERERVIYRWE